MRNVVLTSFTPLEAPGGVPRWNRDIVAAFPEGRVRHYSWSDMLKEMRAPFVEMPEWDKAHVLNQWLIWSKRITKDDVILTDGFWGLGLEDFPNVVSVAHGNWSHTTKDDVDNGIPPEFPQHHAIQVEYRRKHLERGGRMVAVSDFIAHQCEIQWDFKMPVINNGIDMTKFIPSDHRIERKRPVIVHGVTNSNKGFDHIRILEKRLDADIVLLDDAAKFFGVPKFGVPKYRALAQADLVVIPSAHEGNSYFCLESLASDVPVVAYNVGLMYRARLDRHNFMELPLPSVGEILLREKRSPEYFLDGVRIGLEWLSLPRTPIYEPRRWVSQFSLPVFQQRWRDYLQKEFGVT